MTARMDPDAVGQFVDHLWSEHTAAVREIERLRAALDNARFQYQAALGEANDARQQTGQPRILDISPCRCGCGGIVFVDED